MFHPYYIGDFAPGTTLYVMFNTATAADVPTILASGVVSVYKDDDLTQSVQGVTLGVDHDTITGLNLVTLVTSNAFYTAGHDYEIVLTAGTVNSVSNVGRSIAKFSLSNRTLPAIPAGWLTTAGIADGALTAAKIATGAITAAKIATDAITADKITADAMTATDKLSIDAAAAIFRY